MALFKWCNAAYWLGLMIWVSAIISGAVAAIGVFSTLPKLHVRIEQYNPAFGDDTAQHGRLAGGMVMEPIFSAVGMVQIGAAVIVIVAVMLQFSVFKMRLRSPANALRLLCIIAAVGLLGFHIFSLAPRMNRELRSYWHAAELNDAAAMKSHMDAFQKDHHVDDGLFLGMLGALFITIAASAAAMTPAKPATAASALEKPALLRSS